MRRWILVCLLGVGCAHAPPHVASPDPDRVEAPPPEPPLPSVRLVAHRPRRDRARFVGRVVGTADTIEIVAAARHAEAELKRRAAALGADVVKIDLVSPPPDRQKGPSRRMVLLAGRAYRTRAN